MFRETLGVDSKDINRRSKLKDQVEQELAQFRRTIKLVTTAAQRVSNDEEDNSSSDKDNGEEAE